MDVIKKMPGFKGSRGGEKPNLLILKEANFKQKKMEINIAVNISKSESRIK